MNKRFLIKRMTITISLILIALASATNFAQSMPVPANLQAALFQKIFAFDKTLAAKGNVQVAIIGNSSSDIVAALQSVGISAKAVNSDQVPSDVSVVYIMPGVTSTKQQSASKGILSISGVPSYAENGSVSIGLGVEDGKPKIIINMSQLKAERQELSADLLKIAKIIQ
jgi:YfiR/HmsC-like